MYSVAMSIVDYLPVLFYGAAAFLLQKNLYNKMSKGAYALLCAGTIDVFMAGLLKATYKLLYALNICDFQPLSQMFFPVQALGFIMSGIAILCMLTLNQGKDKMLAVASPTLFTGTFIFVMFMVLGVGFTDIGLSVMAAKMKKKKYIPLFIFACVASLAMGYLSSKDFTNPLFNWIGEIVNTLGQLSLFVGVKLLDKAGLNKFEL